MGDREGGRGFWRDVFARRRRRVQEAKGSAQRHGETPTGRRTASKMRARRRCKITSRSPCSSLVLPPPPLPPPHAPLSPLAPPHPSFAPSLPPSFPLPPIARSLPFTHPPRSRPAPARPTKARSTLAHACSELQRPQACFIVSASPLARSPALSVWHTYPPTQLPPSKHTRPPTLACLPP